MVRLGHEKAGWTPATDWRAERSGVGLADAMLAAPARRAVICAKATIVEVILGTAGG